MDINKQAQNIAIAVGQLEAMGMDEDVIAVIVKEDETELRKLLHLPPIQGWREFLPGLSPSEMIILNALIYLLTHSDEKNDCIIHAKVRRSWHAERLLYEFLFPEEHQFWVRFASRRTLRKMWSYRHQKFDSIGQASFVRSVYAMNFRFYSLVSAVYYCGILNKSNEFSQILTSIQYCLTAKHLMSDLYALQMDGTPLSDSSRLRLVRLKSMDRSISPKTEEDLLRKEILDLFKVASKTISGLTIPGYQEYLKDALDEFEQGPSDTPTSSTRP